MRIEGHFNRGHIFRLPAQSRYADVRQLIVSNPGIRIDHLLAVLAKEWLKTILEAKKTWQLASIKPIRQCPECSKALYHNDVFNSHWLRLCPVHKKN